MSLWTSIASMANKMEERRKQKEFDAYGGGSRLSKEYFVNYMHSFGEEISKYVEYFGGITVQRVDKTLDKHTNDIVTGFKQLWEDRTEALTKYFDVGFTKLKADTTELLDNFFSAHNSAAELRHQEAERKAARRQDVTMKHVLGMFGHIQSAELNNSDRFLTIMERVRESEVLAEKRHNTTFNSMICLYEHMMDHLVRANGKIDELMADRNNRTPSLDWIISNEGELRRVCHALSCIENNVIPFENAAKQAIDGLRALGDFSHEAIDAVLRAKQDEYANAA